MPLLTSPIDGSPMRQINRYGIEIDICPTSGGIWLDKGELEKLMHIIKEETMSEQHSFSAIQERASAYRHKTNEHYGGKGDSSYYYKNKGYKKKSKMSKLLDIFDL